MKINENMKQIALLLIEEDLKYHRLVKHLAEMDVHIEFYPDIATAVLGLLWPNMDEREQENRTNQYVQLVGSIESQENTGLKILNSIIKPDSTN